MSLLRIGAIGDFDAQFRRPQDAIEEALGHSADALRTSVELSWVPTESLLNERGVTALEGYDGLWATPGNYASAMGALRGIRYARENDVPFLGTCGGFQHVVLEYARNVLGVEDAASEHDDLDAPHLFITGLACSIGGTRMVICIRSDTLASCLYGSTEAMEDYYCNFGLNPAYRSDIEKGGLLVTGSEEDGEARILELPTHRFYLATLFVPQTSSAPNNPHPLVNGLVHAAREFQEEKRASARSGVAYPI
jgi:CTP synthase (UTP-ammonia lyase)